MENPSSEFDYLFFFISPLVIFGILLGISYLRQNFRDVYGTLMLGVVFFFTSYVYLVDFLVFTGVIVQFPHLLQTNQSINLLITPLIYLAVLKSLGRRVNFRNSFFHGLPFIFSFFYALPFFLHSSSYKLEFIKQKGLLEAWLGNMKLFLIPGTWISGLWLVQALIYFILLVVLFKTHEPILRFRIRSRNLLRALSFYLGLEILFAAFLISFVKEDLHSLLIVTKIRIGFTFFFSIYFFLRPEILFPGFEKNRFYSNIEKPELNLGSKSSDGSAPLFSSLGDPELLAKYSHLSLIEKKRWKAISSYLKGEKPFLNPDFSIKKLEEETKISSKLIGKIIKRLFDCNFNQFINKLRIEYALDQLSKNPKWKSYTVEALASNVGFYSPNSFYGYFKEYTGKTPREFINELEMK